MSAASKILMGSGGGGADLSISPDFDSKSEWTFATDGALNIGTTGAYTITPARDITVDIEMWGGGGAAGWIYTSSTGTSSNVGAGGGGGFATGRLVLKDGVEYVLNIGEGGDSLTGTSGSGSRANADYRAGGVRANYGPQGAGYSGIFKTSTVSQATAKLIAGGGGSGGDSAFGRGGAGGGTNGQSSTGSTQGGGGGTQASGGSASVHNGSQAGSALLGGGGQNAVTTISCGGGAGYYGGGGGNVGAGGGGSGYFDSSDSDLTLETITTGALNVPGNSGGTNRGGSGDGGATAGASGDDGRIYMAEV